MKGKRLAIIGGAGFISSNLAEELATCDLETGLKQTIESVKSL
ncbi:hypothetical protein ES703_23221 [subsurface metagenome]